MENTQDYPQDNLFLSKPMLQQHFQEAIALILSGVRMRSQ